MGGFGNYMGALFGGELSSSYADHWSDDQWQTLMGRAKPQAWLDQRYHHQSTVAPQSDPSAPKDPHAYKIDPNSLGDVSGLLTDNTTYQEVGKALHGGTALNWEDWTFGELRTEKDALKPDKLEDLSTAWTTHGNTLKTESENFKKTVDKAIAGKWSGASAKAAEAASQHVTETSIYDFTPATDALSKRLLALKAAFDDIRSRFPDYANHKLIDKFDDANKAGVDKAVNDYNHRYHFDSDGHLQLGNGQYVSPETAMDDANRVKQSVADYQQAVQLFRDTYQPAVQTVAQNFPNLPAPPNMTFNPTGPGPNGPGPTGPGGGPTGGAGGGPKLGGMPDLKNSAGLKPSDLPKIPDPKLPDTKLPNTDLPDTQTTDPTTPTGLNGLTDPVKSAMDAATGAAKDAIGQAADAAKNAAGQGLQVPNLGGPQGPPEGVLGLGPQGLGGGGGGVGKGAGGSAGGAPMPRNLGIGKSIEAPATAAAKAPATATGAGLASGAGSPGAGAPAAGQRGGDQNGKGHQVNKALRRKKNGKDVIGDAEATVAVVGAPENLDQPEGLTVDHNDRAEQPDGANPGVGPTSRRIPRPRQPMQIPGQ